MYLMMAPTARSMPTIAISLDFMVSFRYGMVFNGRCGYEGYRGQQRRQRGWERDRGGPLEAIGRTEGPEDITNIIVQNNTL